MTSVATFTDLYHPTINGVTNTIALWKAGWTERYGRMAVVYPRTPGYRPGPDEYPVRSVRAPLYAQYRLGIPAAPELPTPDVVHVHTPFTVGITGVEFARHTDLPLVGSYHTLLSERVRYMVSTDDIMRGLRRLVRQYERWFFDAFDLLITPSATAKSHLQKTVGIATDVEVLSNGIDTSFFRPTDPGSVRGRHDLSPDDNVVGYTGRHSPEKNLSELIEAVDGTDLTLLLAGDGPARPDLEEYARDRDADVRFLGFLGYSQLPAFYSALDVFAFPSPTETQGLVAMEAIACGTPVVACDEGALPETVDDTETGYIYPSGDPEALRVAIDRAIEHRPYLRERCLSRRSDMQVERSLERLHDLYGRVQVTNE